MKKLRLVVLNKGRAMLVFSLSVALLFASGLLFRTFMGLSTGMFVDPESGIIVIDPGHGGIDGGASGDGLLEKEINLEISKLLKAFLEERNYKVVMTREEDVSLETLDNTGGGRHQRDLNARADIINGSNAQLFLSIHVDCNLKKPSTDGAIVFYSDRLRQSKALAYCVQRSLNAVQVNGKSRTIHDPQEAGYFVLVHSKIPGALVETAFISNREERRLLATREFRWQLAKAIADGVQNYLNGPSKVFVPEGRALAP